MAIENIGLYPITIDVYKKHKETTVYANDNDLNGRGLLISLVKNGAQFDSTGITLKIGFRNAVGEERLYDCDIVNAAEGQYKVFYPTEMLSGNGGRVVKLEIKAYEGTGALLNYAPLFVYVNASEVSDQAIEGTNEGSALFKAITEYEAIGGQYIAAENARNAEYDTAEASRNALYSTKEQARDNLYATAESSRDSLYQAEEGVRNTQYNSSEIDRNALYASAESARDTLYQTAESNRDTLLNSVNAQLAEKANKTQEAWITPTLLNAWTNYTTFTTQYFRDSIGLVHLRGLIAGGANGTVVFNLPVGYRPDRGMFYFRSCANSPYRFRVDVGTDGNVSVQLLASAESYLSLNGIYFKAV